MLLYSLLGDDWKHHVSSIQKNEKKNINVEDESNKNKVCVCLSRTKKHAEVERNIFRIQFMYKRNKTFNKFVFTVKSKIEFRSVSGRGVESGWLFYRRSEISIQFFRLSSRLFFNQKLWIVEYAASWIEMYRNRQLRSFFGVNQIHFFPKYNTRKFMSRAVIQHNSLN